MPHPHADLHDPAVRLDIERALTSVPGVLGARLITATGRSIDELHVLTVVDRSPSRTARDVRTLLMARFGVPTDRRAISVVPVEERPTGPGRPVAARPVIETVAVGEHHGTSVAEVALRDREVIHAATSVVDPIAPSPADPTVTAPADPIVTAPADHHRADTSRAVAEATLGAVAALVGGQTDLELQGVELVEVADHRLVAVLVRARTAHAEALLSGTALVRSTVEDAVARAVMDGVNRALATWPA